MSTINSKGKYDLKCSKTLKMEVERQTGLVFGQQCCDPLQQALQRSCRQPPLSYSPLLKTLPNWPVSKTKLSSCVRSVGFKHHSSRELLPPPPYAWKAGQTFTIGTRVGRRVPKEQQSWAALGPGDLRDAGREGGRDGCPDILLLEASSLLFMSLPPTIHVYNDCLPFQKWATLSKHLFEKSKQAFAFL